MEATLDREASVRHLTDVMWKFTAYIGKRLPTDVTHKLADLRSKETNPLAKAVYQSMKENQEAARELGRDPEIGLILVIGGKRSANTRHLWEICARSKPSHLIQGADDIDPAWFEGVATVGITAGASTPDYVVDEVEAAIHALQIAPTPSASA